MSVYVVRRYPYHSSHLSKVKMHFDIVEGDMDHLAIGLFDQSEINEPGDVGMDFE